MIQTHRVFLHVHWRVQAPQEPALAPLHDIIQPLDELNYWSQLAGDPSFGTSRFLE